MMMMTVLMSDDGWEKYIFSLKSTLLLFARRKMMTWEGHVSRQLVTEHEVCDLSCAKSHVYFLLCKGKLSVVKKWSMHPPPSMKDTTWITPLSKRASAQSRVLLIQCLDKTIGYWFLVVALITVAPGQKRAFMTRSTLRLLVNDVSPPFEGWLLRKIIL